MNEIFRSSWIIKTQPIYENFTLSNSEIINESIAKILKEVKKKMKSAGIGVPYRDASLFFYEFLKDKHGDRIPQDFKDTFETRQPQAKDVNALMGRILMDEKLPEGWVDKMADEFDKYSKAKKQLGDKEVDAVTEFLNRAAGFREYRGVRPGEEPKKNFGSLEDIKAKVDIGGMGGERLKKGANALETLNLNLDPDEVLVFDEESAMGYGVYTLMKNGLKFRVTLQDNDANPKKVGEITGDNLVSLVVTEPGEKERFAGPSVDDDGIEFEREKKVADYPYEKGDDFSTPDPEDIARGKQYEIDEDDDEEEEDNEDIMRDRTSSKAKQKDTKEEDSEETVKMSPQQINAFLMQQHQNKMRNRFGVERRYTLGY